MVIQQFLKHLHKDPDLDRTVAMDSHMMIRVRVLLATNQRRKKFRILGTIME